jgi:hypothetical protein
MKKITYVTVHNSGYKNGDGDGDNTHNGDGNKVADDKEGNGERRRRG